MEQTSKTLSALVIGSTGAVGRELTDILVKSSKYSSVTLLVRRKLDRWSNYTEEEKQKLKIVLCDNLDILNADREAIEKIFEPKFDSLFCCLGSRVGRGDQEFTRVDYDYFVYCADFCERFNVPYLATISSKGANPKSWFMYFKVKGRADEECLKRNINCISIFRPGAILDRDNDHRLGEAMLKFVPFIDKIRSTNLARAIYNESIAFHNSENKSEMRKKIYTHSEIERLI